MTRSERHLDFVVSLKSQGGYLGDADLIRLWDTLAVSGCTVLPEFLYIYAILPWAVGFNGAHNVVLPIILH